MTESNAVKACTFVKLLKLMQIGISCDQPILIMRILTIEFYIMKYVLLTLIVVVTSLFGHAQTPPISGMDELEWEKIMPGVWKASFGETQLNALDYANPPKVDAIKELGDTSFPFNKKATQFLLNSSRASISLPLDETERIYGLGLEFNGINRRGNVYTLKVDHYGGVPGYTHAPVPFYVSSKGYGVLINSSKRVKIHVGVGNRKDGKLPELVDRTTGENWSARPLSDAVEASVQDKHKKFS